jgi:hypothetical protein
VLLLPTSIHHFIGHALKRFSSTSVLKTCLEIDCLNIATSYFTHHIQGRKGKEYVVSLARKDQTLNFYFENSSRVWVDLIKTFSSFVEEGRVQRHRHGERMLEEDEEAASALVLIGRSPPIPSKQDTVASVPCAKRSAEDSEESAPKPKRGTRRGNGGQGETSVKRL